MSKGVSGAEKRIFRIASLLNNATKKTFFIVNSELYIAAQKDQELSSRLKIINDESRLIIISDSKIVKSKLMSFILLNIKAALIIRKYKIGVMHLVLNGLYTSFGSKILGSKVIFEVTSPDVAKSLIEGKLKYFKCNIDRIVAVSPTVNNILITKWSENNEYDMVRKITCSPIPFFISSENNWDVEKENLIVFASRFIERKNPVLFAEAIKLFLDERPDWKIAILGKGPLKDQIESILRDYIDNRVVEIKYTEKLYWFLSRSKIFVSLIYPDNYPSQSVLEAMAMKNAIVATNVGSTSKLVTTANGILIDKFDKKEVYEKLIKLSSNQDLIKQMGEESVKKIENDFSPMDYISNLTEIYDEFT
ncbi:glycosyltransferase family 4 protein [Natranaerovirga pectinivora]|nr:glycosyltransferase [Natranaerovirga pectinivora]